ncbi:ribosomal RNA methyltransferase Nop2 [Dendrobium catenatum]|uniref:Ribosomal RNA methyltransferase Nop2 n=2 Tax=Dendrobium catenatum TaxID=906689 RepID=A0A2I0VYR8_9ASPA|nr:ribosomal RNA methyltransferase Nop2 [Dendrobium catenatum]
MDIKILAAEMDLTCIRAYRLDALKSVSQTVVGADVVATNLDREIYDITIMKSSSRLDNGDMHRVNMDRDKIDAEIMSMGNRGNGRYVSKKELRKPTQMMKNGPGRNHSIGGRAENSKGFLPNSFDRVLLDAPCSALGLRPRLFASEETMESLQTHAKYQRKMFDQAVQLVRTGGVIVYSTCTINPGENEALVRYALDTYKFLSLAPQNPKVGGPGLVGKCELFGGKHAETWLTQSEAELVQRFDPSATLDTIGFFIAKFNVGQK